MSDINLTQLHASLYMKKNKSKTGRQATRKKGKTYKIGRDAKTGRFIPVAIANRRKSTAIVETIKKKKK